MSGTDPGLFGVVPLPSTESESDTSRPSKDTLEESDRTLARELLDAKVGRIHVHPLQRAESAGFSAVSYRAEAHRPPRPNDDHKTLPDATVLVNVTQPLGAPPFPLAPAAPATVGPSASTAALVPRTKRDAPTDPDSRRLELAVSARREPSNRNLDVPAMLPSRRVPVGIALAFALAALALFFGTRTGSDPLRAKTTPQTAKAAHVEASAPAVAPSPPTTAASPAEAPSVPRPHIPHAAASAAPAVVTKPASPRVAPVQPASVPVAVDPDLPPVKLLDEK